MNSYPDFISSCGYGEIDGIFGANCRHIAGGHIDGQPLPHTREELDEINNVKYEYKDPQTGKTETLTAYEATQKQRAIERQIRKWKKRLQAYKAADNATPEITAATAEARGKVREWQSVMRDFLKQVENLPRMYDRERVPLQGR